MTLRLSRLSGEEHLEKSLWSRKKITVKYMPWKYWKKAKFMQETSELKLNVSRKILYTFHMNFDDIIWKSKIITFWFLAERDILEKIRNPFIVDLFFAF